MADDNRQTSPSDEAKARFKAALDAKNARHRESHGDTAENAGTVRGSETKGPVRQEFRRKAGG